MDDWMRAQAAVMQLHAHYVDAVWRKDSQAFGACFASDAQWRLSGFVIDGRSAITEFMTAAFARYGRILLTFRTPIIDVRDGAITARTYVSEQSVLADGTAYGPIGTYYERFVEEDGRLRFAWRLFMTEYVGGPDLKGQFYDTPDFGPPPAMPDLDQPTFNRSGILGSAT
ncbi:MAG: nuclear transport factor 2 family protein [Novosphingobium sp.]